VLFYSPGSDVDFDDLQKLGGVARQYLSHRDEAGPMLAAVAERFGARLYASAAEVNDVARFRTVDVPFSGRHVDDLGIEIIPTPGHTPGSTCYLVPGADGVSYLFTGDTIYLSDSGKWTAGYIEGMSDKAALASTLELLATLNPDLVVSSAYAGDEGAHLLGSTPWSACVEEALSGLR
jgi:hydroxyacylglutathione hydrolase